MVDKKIVGELKSLYENSVYLNEYPTKCKNIRNMIKNRMKFKINLLEQLLENGLIEERQYEKFSNIFKYEEKRYYLCLNGYISVNELTSQLT